MIYAPVFIPTLNRASHLKRCIESLARCPEAKETTLFIGVDFPLFPEHITGYNEVCRYVETICGFKDVVVLKRNKNFGAEENRLNGAIAVYKRFDRMIFSEDDNVFSPVFLKYMNLALERYAADDKVVAISGYLRDMPTLDIIGADECFFANVFSAWGFGTWRDRKFQSFCRLSQHQHVLSQPSLAMKIFRTKDYVFDKYARMVHRGISYADLSYVVRMILDDSLVLFPPKSLVRNMGHDGSGEHCGNISKDGGYARQEIIEDVDFNPAFPESIERNATLVARFDSRDCLDVVTRMRVLFSYFIWYAYKRFFRILF